MKKQKLTLLDLGGVVFQSTGTSNREIESVEKNGIKVILFQSNTQMKRVLKGTHTFQDIIDTWNTMKKILVALIAISPAVHLNSQALNLLEENKRWTVEYADQVTLPPEIDQLYYTYKGDTAIGATEYQKFGNGAILREDTIEKQVYLFTGDEECLLYDFAASPGDTADLCEGIRIVIDSITQFTTADGLLRKKFHVSGDDAINLEYYIEGIGTNLGFVEISEVIGPPNLDLMCVKKAGLEIYGDRCEEVVAVFHHGQPKNSIHVYPNPTHGMVMVESAIPGLRVQVVDVNGKLVLEGLQKANEFQVSRLDPGLYFLLLYDEKGQCVGNKRFMVME